MRVSCRIIAPALICFFAFTNVAATPQIDSLRCYVRFRIDSIPVGARIYDGKDNYIGTTTDTTYVVQYASCSWVEYIKQSLECSRLFTAKKKGYNDVETGGRIDHCDYDSMEQAKRGSPITITIRLDPL